MMRQHFSSQTVPVSAPCPLVRAPEGISMPSRVAVVQSSPVVFDLKRTIEKLTSLTHEAAKQGAKLVLFPEAFISAYPRGLDFGAVVGSRTDAGREDFRRYWESSVDVPGPAFRSSFSSCSLQQCLSRRWRNGARCRDSLLHRPLFRSRRNFPR